VHRLTVTFFGTRIEIVTNFHRHIIVTYKNLRLKLWLNIGCTQRAFFASNYIYLQEQNKKICSYPEVHYEMKGTIWHKYMHLFSCKWAHVHCNAISNFKLLQILIVDWRVRFVAESNLSLPRYI